MAHVWKIAPGLGAEDWELFRDRGCIGLGWLPDSNYQDFRGKDEILDALEKKHGKGKAGYGSGAAEMVDQFVHEVKPGHLVVANRGYNGVVGIGVITSNYLPPNSNQNPLRTDMTTHRHHVRRVNWLVIDEIEIPGKQFFRQQTLHPLDTEMLSAIRQVYATVHPHLNATLEQISVGYQVALSGVIPEELTESQTFAEGAVRKISVNAYERNSEARQKCLKTYGTTCRICGFNFGAEYGPDADGFIHVHHLQPLSEIGGKYKVDPITDLCPVCPNCHAVIHLGGECRTIEEVREMREKCRSTRNG